MTAITKTVIGSPVQIFFDRCVLHRVDDLVLVSATRLRDFLKADVRRSHAGQRDSGNMVPSRAFFVQFPLRFPPVFGGDHNFVSIDSDLRFEQRESDLCTTSRDANQRGNVDRGCRSCGQRHGRREVSSIASREPEGKLRCFLTDALTNHLVRVVLEKESGERRLLRQHGRPSWKSLVTSEDPWSNVYRRWELV